MGHSRSAVKTPVVDAQLASVLERLERMRGLPEGWNGYDALPPDARAITRAGEWVQELYAEIRQWDLPWVDPLVSASADGDPVFEWWHGKKKITVYLMPGSVEYVRVWGPDVNDDMDEGDANTPESRRLL